MIVRSLSRSLLLLAAIVSFASGADWPQWRGPGRDGKSKETGLLKEWPKSGPKLVWQVNNIGNGYSTPAIVNGVLYLISNDGADKEFVQALSAKDGQQIWASSIGKVGPNRGPQYPGSRSTPTVDGDVLYALGSDGDLVCMRIKNGDSVWRKNLRTDFGGMPGNWAYSESPLVDGNVLVCTPGGAEATLVALDKKTGELVWKSAVPGGDEAAYASAIIVDAAGVKQYVQFLQKGLVGIEAKTGKFLWRYARTAEGSPANIPTPVASGPLVYSAAGRSGGGLVRVQAKNGTVEAEQVYFFPKLPASIGGSVELEGNLYGTTSQGMMCADFESGEPRWQERGIGAGSLCYADGLFYVHGENGDMALVEATPEGYREKGRFTPPEQPDRGQAKAWTYPVVANGRLYVRDLGTLWCYDVRASNSE